MSICKLLKLVWQKLQFAAVKMEGRQAEKGAKRFGIRFFVPCFDAFCWDGRKGEKQNVLFKCARRSRESRNFIPNANQHIVCCCAPRHVISDEKMQTRANISLATIGRCATREIILPYGGEPFKVTPPPSALPHANKMHHHQNHSLYIPNGLSVTFGILKRSHFI
jgi:hypothetical protein